MIILLKAATSQQVPVTLGTVGDAIAERKQQMMMNGDFPSSSYPLPESLW